MSSVSTEDRREQRLTKVTIPSLSQMIIFFDRKTIILLIEEFSRGKLTNNTTTNNQPSVLHLKKFYDMNVNICTLFQRRRISRKEFK